MYVFNFYWRIKKKIVKSNYYYFVTSKIARSRNKLDSVLHRFEKRIDLYTFARCYTYKYRSSLQDITTLPSKMESEIALSRDTPRRTRVPHGTNAFRRIAHDTQGMSNVFLDLLELSATWLNYGTSISVIAAVFIRDMLGHFSPICA